MKTKMKIMLAVLAIGASAFAVSAQDNNPPGNGGPDGGQGGYAGGYDERAADGERVAREREDREPGHWVEC